MIFHVGQKVVCIDNNDCFPAPIVGNIYTVATVKYINDTNDPGWGITLIELPTFESDDYWAEYDASRFRPVVETKSEVSFTLGADPDSEKWDNRKVKVS